MAVSLSLFTTNQPNEFGNCRHVSTANFHVALALERKSRTISRCVHIAVILGHDVRFCLYNGLYL